MAKWCIESVDRYYYHSGRNYLTYVELTYWYDEETRERKEEKREVSIRDDHHFQLPDWARGITKQNRDLNV